MSAICGIIHFNGKPVEKADLETMVESSPYRGPDGVRYHLDGNAGFAHMAFHVTPESVHEKQPVISSDRRFVLCADVRLDNREELFSRLDIRNCPDLVVTDPELILHAFQKWGEDCVKHLLGDFVFAVWDTREQSLFLARDPLGAFGIYYSKLHHGFIFSSEIAAILNQHDVQPVINEKRVLCQLEFSPGRHEDTFFKGIHSLPRGQCLTVSHNGIRKRTYWDIDPEHSIVYQDESEYAEHLLDLVRQAVRSRTRSIGPVGISLSGGNDSTLLAAVAAGQLGNTDSSLSALKSFSYVFDQISECDERQFIEPVVARYSLDAELIPMDTGWALSRLENQIIPREHLWINPLIHLHTAVAESAQAAGCRVLLDGQYGDALFAGTNLVISDLIRRGRVGSLYRYCNQYSEQLHWRRDFLRTGVLPLLPQSIRQAISHLRQGPERPVNAGLMPDKLELLPEIREESRQSPPVGMIEPGKKARYAALLSANWSQGNASSRGRSFGRYKLEPSSPYFDRRIVEYLLAIPTNQVNRPDRHRWLQYSAMKKVLPKAVCERTLKTSLAPLVKQGLHRENQVIAMLLRDPLMVKTGWVSRQYASELAESVELNGASLNWRSLSNCLHLELWLRATKAPLEGSAGWHEPYFLNETVT